MPVLTPREPMTQDHPLLVVENKLAPGRYRFQLVVTDDSGLESEPAELVVLVTQPTPAPTPTPTGPVLRPNILTRATTTLNPRVIRPIRRPQ